MFPFSVETLYYTGSTFTYAVLLAKNLLPGITKSIIQWCHLFVIKTQHSLHIWEKAWGTANCCKAPWNKAVYHHIVHELKDNHPLNNIVTNPMFYTYLSFKIHCKFANLAKFSQGNKQAVLWRVAKQRDRKFYNMFSDTLVCLRNTGKIMAYSTEIWMF